MFKHAVNQILSQAWRVQLIIQLQCHEVNEAIQSLVDLWTPESVDGSG